MHLFTELAFSSMMEHRLSPSGSAVVPVRLRPYCVSLSEVRFGSDRRSS